MSSPLAESSIQDGNPVYKFAFSADGTDYRYTNSAYEMTDSNGTYTPAAISFSQIITTSEIAKNGIQIELPRDNALAQIFLGRVPEGATSLTIYRSHEPTIPGDLYWKGRVSSVQADSDSVTLNCEDIFTSMQRPGLRARYQKTCRHALYSTDCGVTQASFANATTITAVSGDTITVTAVTPSPEIPSDYFVGGIVELSDGTKRNIVAQAGWVLTLLYPFNDLTVGSPLPPCTLYPGCDHTTTDCNGRFSNLLNFGGYPYIPSKSPFQGNVTGSIV